MVRCRHILMILMKNIFFLLFITFTFFINTEGVFAGDRLTQEQVLESVVQIYVIDKKTDTVHSSGSGVIINPEKKQVLTALHVVNPATTNRSRFDLHVCVNKDNSGGSFCYFAATVQSYNQEYDVALIVIDRAFDKSGKKLPLSQFKKQGITDALPDIYYERGFNIAEPKLGEDIWLAGYPSSGGSTITLSAGIVSGFESGRIGQKNTIVRIKTDAAANHGNSGGPVFDSENRFLGLAISVSTDITPITFITSWAVMKDMIYNGIIARPGILCYDYKNMHRKRGECVCNDDLVWNTETYTCDAEKELESTPKEGEKNHFSLPQVQQSLESEKKDTEEGTDNKLIDEKTPPTQKESPKKIKKDVPPDFSEKEKEIGAKTVRNGIFDTLSECKPIKKYGKDAFRMCFRESFANFIRTRQKILQKARRLCKHESKKRVTRTQIKACTEEKLK